MKRKLFSILFAFLMTMLPLAMCAGGGIFLARSESGQGKAAKASAVATAEAVDASKNDVFYNEEQGYFYFVDGKYPQSYVGDTNNNILNSNVTGEADYFLTIGGQSCGVWTYNNTEFLKITAPKSVSVSIDGATVSFVANNPYWFEVEPIIWRVSDYGTPESKAPEYYGIRYIAYGRIKAVSDVVLDWTCVESDRTAEGWSYQSSDLYTTINNNYVTLVDSFLYANKDERWAFDSFSLPNVTNNPVTTTSTTDVEGIFQASLEEIGENLNDFKATGSDLVCMLAGTSDTTNLTYSTRDLENLNNGKAVYINGRTKNVWLSENAGVRLAYSYYLDKNASTLETGQNVAKAIKKSATYDTTDLIVTSIVFDYYTSEGTYAPSGTDLISGLTGVDVSADGDGSIMLYGGGAANVYVLSRSGIFANATSSYMFYNCRSVTSISFNNFNTSNVTSMYRMFYYCAFSSSDLTLDLTSFDTSKVTNMSFMFRDCRALTSLDISSFDTSNVTDMSYMFQGCIKLTNLNLSSFDTFKVTNMSYMFNGCSALTTIYIGDGWNTDKVTNSTSMFNSCGKLVGGAGTAYNASYVDKTYAHDDGGTRNPGYLTLKSVPVYLTTGQNIAEAIKKSATYNATDLIVTSIVFDYYTSEGSYELDGVDLISGLTGVDVSAGGDGGIMLYGGGTAKVYVLSKGEIFANADSSNMFYSCRGVTSIIFNNFNAPNMKNMNSMFDSCSSLTSLDLSSFNTSQVKNMEHMFWSCSALTTIYVGDGWSTDAVTSSSSMFSSCSKLVGGAGTAYDSSYVDKTYARIDGWTNSPGYLTYKTKPVYLTTGQNIVKAIKKSATYDTTDLIVTSIVFDYYTSEGSYELDGVDLISGLTGVDVSADGDGSIMLYGGGTANVYVLSRDAIFANADCSYMFYNCRSVKSITFNNFDTSKVTNMYRMFYCCAFSSSGLTLDLTSFNTSKVTNMSYMFRDCRALTSLDISSFDTSQVTNMEHMFWSCSALTTIYVGDGWNTDKVTNSTSMFNSCGKLVGGAGTAYNASYVDKTYAKVDGGTSNPGYLSEKRKPVYLTTGQNMAMAIKNATSFSTLNGTVTSIVFDYYTSDGAYAPSGTNLISGLTGKDVSVDGDGSIMLYGGGTANVYVLSRDAIFANADSSNMFYYCSGVTSITFNNFDTSNVTNMYGMFIYCSGLTGLDLSNFDTSNVTNMCGMFVHCTSLTSLDLSNFDTSNVTNMQSMFVSCSGLTSLDLSNFDTSSVTTMSSMFSSCNKLTSLDVSNFDTSSVTNMRYMFYSCSGLTSLDVSNFDTSKVTDMSSMFDSCWSLTSLDLSNFNTSNVTNMGYMFSYCSSLITIYVGDGWNTDKVTSSSGMFSSCSKLVGGAGTTYNASYVDKTYAKVDGGTSNPGYLTYNAKPVYLTTGQNMAMAIKNVTSYSTSNSTVTSIVFDYYTSDGAYAPSGTNLISGLTGKDVSADGDGSIMLYGGGTSNVYVLSKGKIFANANSSNMFYNCSGVTSIVFNNFDTSNVTNMDHMFYNCRGLTSLDVSKFNTSNVTNMSAMFTSCSSLTSLDVSNFATSKVTTMQSMFWSCSGLTSLDLSNFDTSNVTNIYGMFNNCSGLTSLDLSSFDTSKVTNMSYMFDSCAFSSSGLTLDLTSFDTSNVTNMSYMFDACYGLTSLDVSNFDTSNVTDMSSMFTSCRRLTSLDLSNFDTSKVTDMSSMFASCWSLTSLDLSNFDTSKVTNMSGMFYDCNLTSLDLSNFDTSNVTNMSSMFSSCNYLKSLDLSNFDTSNVTKMGSMFYSCNYLKSLDLSNFDTSNVTNMTYMFDGCRILTSLDLSNFDTSKVTDMSWMFYSCSGLTTIYAGDGWNTDKVTSSNYMFTSCVNLVGGAGTTYNASYVDKTYAKVDGGTGNPGYLTYKAASGSNLFGNNNAGNLAIEVISGVLGGAAVVVLDWLAVDFVLNKKKRFFK